MIKGTDVTLLSQDNAEIIANFGLQDGEFRLAVDGNAVYALIFRPMSWQEAEGLAGKLPGRGWHLASIHSKEEHYYVCSLAATYGIGCFWIGFTDRAQEGTFVWSDGSPVNFTAWHPDEPNEHNGEDYTVCITADRDWNDYRGDVPMPSLLKRSR